MYDIWQKNIEFVSCCLVTRTCSNLNGKGFKRTPMFCLSCLNRHCFSFMLLHIFLIFFSFIDSMSHWNRLILLPKQFSWYIHIIIVAQFDVYTRLQLLNCDQHVISRKMMMVLVAVWPFIEHCSNFTAASARTTSDWVFFFLNVHFFKQCT